MASRREQARDLNFGEAPFVDPMSAATQSSPLTGRQRAQLASSHSASRLSTIPESSRSGNRSDIAQSGSDFDSSLYTYSDADTDLDRAKLVQHSSFNPSANAWVPSTPAKWPGPGDSSPLATESHSHPMTGVLPATDVGNHPRFVAENPAATAIGIPLSHVGVRYSHDGSELAVGENPPDLRYPRYVHSQALPGDSARYSVASVERQANETFEFGPSPSYTSYGFTRPPPRTAEALANESIAAVERQAQATFKFGPSPVYTPYGFFYPPQQVLPRISPQITHSHSLNSLRSSEGNEEVGSSTVEPPTSDSLSLATVESQAESPYGFSPESSQSVLGYRQPQKIPHSYSLNSLRSSEGSEEPANSTPTRRHGAFGRGYFSPGVTTAASEPRNYAPRTAGRAGVSPLMMQPPPRFDLGAAAATPVDNEDRNMEAQLVRQIVRPFGVRLSDTTGLSEIPLDRINTAPLREVQESNKLVLLTDTRSGLPTLAEAMDPANFPFVESARMAKPMNWGIVKLKNIPFATTRAEVIAFLGRNSKILNDSDEGVHIIMDKVTSKTMDAYVEFVSLEDAMRAVERHRLNVAAGRYARLGERTIEVEVTSQGHLMKDLFPIARGVFWYGVVPEILPYNHNQPWDNFKGFISEEEMVMLVKHVEVPHRSPFSRDCPQRPFECLISTIKKFPWFRTDCITIKEREAIYQATLSLIRQLTRSILFQEDTNHLTPLLLRRLVSAAMFCPAFTPCMKDGIAWMTNMQALDMEYYQLPRFSNSWRHQYAIGPKPGFPLDLVEWYVAVIREQSSRDILSLPLRERAELQHQAEQTDMYWGYFWSEVGYVMGPQFDDLTLAEAAKLEFAAIERILNRAFTQN
ncbi:hypothetical protein TGAMA5MH_06448 [Trichoderma gamsii]|uniref:RRM domain-containing protein n=1 Tax=Trichoderma gamsii TaxID=398673 RepID=A0A2K0T813_9HYPO|nr:hypothetical protein TGAMA5MH_06448 [Trichoderma gamsii]